MSGNFKDLETHIAKPGQTEGLRRPEQLGANPEPSFRNLLQAFPSFPGEPNQKITKLAEKNPASQKPANLTNINNPNVLDRQRSNPFEKTEQVLQADNNANPFSESGNLQSEKGEGVPGESSLKETPNKQHGEFHFNNLNDFSFRKNNPNEKPPGAKNKIGTPERRQQKLLLNQSLLKNTKLSPKFYPSPKMDLFRNYQENRLDSFMSPNPNRSSYSTSQNITSKFGTGMAKFLNLGQNNDVLMGRIFRLKSRFC